MEPQKKPRKVTPRLQKQSLEYTRSRLQFDSVYDFTNKSKKPKERGAWSVFFNEFPDNLAGRGIVVKNCILSPKGFNIYACHADLGCIVRVKLAINRKQLDEPGRNEFTLVGEICDGDGCICAGGKLNYL